MDPVSLSFPTVDVVLPLETSRNEKEQKKEAARALRCAPEEIYSLRLLKHSIDARQKQIKIRMRFEVGFHASLPEKPIPDIPLRQLPASAPVVLIVGCGPAGMFSALECLEQGLKPVILERGKDASARRFDLAPLLRTGTVIENSNYCFGEGGAGTFSDGKLYTRAKKRGPVRKIYEQLVAHGAPEEILIDAHPHIGSNLLPNVVKRLRKTILEHGGDVHFETRVTGLILDSGRCCRGLQTADGREFSGDVVILATGHSARDIYLLLNRSKIRLEPKPFAVGVRIEHSQQHIDEWQYHLAPGELRSPLLPAARYAVATRIHGRGVHSFCMCPGGFIVPASTENGEVVVNGMSLSKRDSPFANSGLVVAVEPEDIRAWTGDSGPLAGLNWQSSLEQQAAQWGGGNLRAPAQRASDFLEGRRSRSLPETSYRPGIQSCPLHEFFPEELTDRLAQGLRHFTSKWPAFATREACMIAVESRTSSPVRIPRDPETLFHPDISGLVPCGEGAGYAGGIVSAALDGLRCARAVAQYLKPSHV